MIKAEALGVIDPVAANENFVDLATNEYPGRGLVMGVSGDGMSLIQLYFLMGRGPSSKARYIRVTENNDAEVKLIPGAGGDPLLLDYTVMSSFLDLHVVSNGKQTTGGQETKEGPHLSGVIEDVLNGWIAGSHNPLMDDARDALDKWSFEPDEPNYTSRITGLLHACGLMGISMIACGADGRPVREYWDASEHGLPEPGFGHLIHTYDGNGNPLPTFSGSPRSTILGDNVEDSVEMYWPVVNETNRVAMIGKAIDLETGEVTFAIRNTNPIPEAA